MPVGIVRDEAETEHVNVHMAKQLETRQTKWVTRVPYQETVVAYAATTATPTVFVVNSKYKYKTAVRRRQVRLSGMTEDAAKTTV
jgi:hypothetical protein